MRRRLSGLAFAVILALPAKAQNFEGPAQVLDASTIEVAGRTLKLYGIAAPAPGDFCPFRAIRIDCGHVATTALMDLTAGTDVACEKVGGTLDAPIAKCTAGGYDLSEGMVYTGWARPLPDAPAHLHDAEATARANRHGLWRGAFPASVDAAAGEH